MKKLLLVTLGVLFLVLPVRAQLSGSDSPIVNTAGHFQLVQTGGVLPALTRFIGGGSLTTNEQGLLLPNPITVYGLTINTTNAPGTGITDTYTMRKNGVDTAITGTIAGTNKTLMITNQNVAFAQGDILSLKYVAGGTILNSTTDIHAVIPYQ